MQTDIRDVSDTASTTLRPGDTHYRAYIGPPAEYDMMGATQFRLLTALGLRETHKVLDFGCGSLRAGRLLIPYLAEGKYHGIEPNRWLVEDAISRQIGNDLVALKAPSFFHNDDFDATVAGHGFDFIIAQSIFSHSGPAPTRRALQSFAKALAPDGLALVTILLPPQEPHIGTEDDVWIYPGCLSYEADTLLGWAGDTGLLGRRLPWYHPRQTWFALTHNAQRLPPVEFDVHLSGHTLVSWHPQG